MMELTSAMKQPVTSENPEGVALTSRLCDYDVEDEPLGFPARHIGPSPEQVQEMLAALGIDSLDALIEQTIPTSIPRAGPPDLPEALDELAMREKLRHLASQNQLFRSLIGQGYYGCVTQPVIARNVLENPGWYTAYTPYQAEIAQGRLEALLNFQTMVADLTGLPIANASLLDEATAAAEGLQMCRAVADAARRRCLIAADCHPQTIAVVRARAAGWGLQCVVAPADPATVLEGDLCGVLLQYPSTDGAVRRYDELIVAAHTAGAKVVVATDLLALTLLRPPGEFGADIAVGSAQRLGLPLGYGGPHAGFLAAKSELARKMPGRIVGISRDATGQPALRLAVQTREQHIRRERATSNICTAQALPAIIAAMHAVYHGPAGLTAIARRIHGWTAVLATELRRMGYRLDATTFFDTLRVRLPAAPDAGDPATGHGAAATATEIFAEALRQRINLRDFGDGSVGVALDERTDGREVDRLLRIFHRRGAAPEGLAELRTPPPAPYPPAWRRTSAFLRQSVFNHYHSETEMQRYLRRLEGRDLSLTTSMIPLGSCTMKLNAAVELEPLSQEQWTDIHPLVPARQAAGYQALFGELRRWLCALTGFSAISLQPNAGAQGEYAALMVIRAYHRRRGQPQRDLCLIPHSAHGTNPASAAAAGLQVLPVACAANGDVDVEDLRRLTVRHHDRLAGLMVTYPSTHGVFEENIRLLCALVHEHGGQVFLDGANFNALAGWCRPADMGVDICHLNLHKTFCIPHGGGGPGMGPIAAAEHLAPFLPGHPADMAVSHDAIGPVTAAPFGSALLLTIPWAYLHLMGWTGLRRATAVAILNANYMARRLAGHFQVLFQGRHGFCAHEFIIDAREFESSAGIKVEDIAKRLMDYGFHAPTVSWPEPGTLMIEPTESESQPELDRFCEALIAIRQEIRDIEQGRADRHNNLLKNAPHTARMLALEPWPFPYSRRQAAYPLAYLEAHKFWPAVARIDNPYGDRNLVCTCPAM